MVFGDILPIILVVVFWIAMAIFTFYFSARAFHAPTEAEIDVHSGDGAHSAH
ncbi:MAG: hypothetical protein KGO05_03960 [Chloroflexota bacterium]|nr:hypothetical protein [Chloroflexota bacterium]